MPSTAQTLPAALAAAMSQDPARPLVTHLGPDGARTELSVRTFENNAAKAANLLRDDVDAAPGDPVALALPLHWQTAVWTAACGLVGAVARIGEDTSGVELAVVGPDGLDLPLAPITLATSLHPLGMPFTTPLPTGLQDAAVEVRAHGDRFSPSYPVRADDPWLTLGTTTLTHAEALDAARALAASLGVEAGGRLLVARPLDRDSLLALVALPLAVGAAVVVLADPASDPDTVRAREGTTAVLS